MHGKKREKSRKIRFKSASAVRGDVVESLESRVMLSSSPIGVALPADATLASATLAPGLVLPPKLKLSGDLAQLASSHLNGGQLKRLAGRTQLQISGGFVAVRIVADTEAAAGPLVKRLTALGYEESLRYENISIGSIPMTALTAASTVSGLRAIEPGLKPTDDTFVGRVTAQSDLAVRAAVARSTYGVDGTGIKVGVISNSYNKDTSGPTTASQDIASGDLPPASKIQIIRDPIQSDDEGRAMMQVVHDVAPGASLAFTSSFVQTSAGVVFDDATMAKAIKELVDAGCDIIVDDIGVPDEPMFSDGLAAKAVDAATAAGVAYFCAAANGGRTGYQSAFRDSGIDFSIDGQDVGRAHDFDSGGNTDIRQLIQIPSGQGISLEYQWDQPFGTLTSHSSNSDMDIFLIDAQANQVVASATTNNLSSGTKDPFEILNYTNQSSNTFYEVVLVRAAGSSPGLMKYVNRQSVIQIDEYDTKSPTLYGHQNSSTGAAVGAAPFFQTPAYGTTPAKAETFSSVGGTQILFDSSGNRLSTPVTRKQPRFTSSDGLNNTLLGSDDSHDSDSFPNFFGTSCASPAAAAVAALMLQKVRSAKPAQIFQALADTALDMDDLTLGGFQSGYDFNTGTGLIRADNAIADLQTIVGGGGGSTHSISGTLFNDTDKDGHFDSNEPNSGVRTVFLDKDGDGALDSGETSVSSDSSGRYTFSGLANGTYHVARVLPSGYVLTNGGKSVSVTVNGASVTGINLGSAPGSSSSGASITGKLWDDLDKDGVFDSNEPASGANKTVFLDANKNKKLDSGEKSTLTASDGSYKFSGLAAGTYYVSRVFPSGYSLSNSSSGYITVALTSGQAKTGVNLGSKAGGSSSGASIGGTLWDDLDKDGIFDGSEPVSGSKVVYLDKNKNHKLDSGETQVMSNGDGVYKFTGLAAGTYYVTRVFPSGYKLSNSSSGYLTITVSSGQSKTGVDLGSKRA